MIAEPNSSTTAETQTQPVEPVQKSPFEDGPLSAAELYRLTLYKWRYSLEAYGFGKYEVRDLMFLKWLHASHLVQG